MDNSKNTDLNYCEELRNLGLLPATDRQESTPRFQRGLTCFSLDVWSRNVTCNVSYVAYTRTPIKRPPPEVLAIMWHLAGNKYKYAGYFDVAAKADGGGVCQHGGTCWLGLLLTTAIATHVAPHVIRPNTCRFQSVVATRISIIMLNYWFSTINLFQLCYISGICSVDFGG